MTDRRAHLGALWEAARVWGQATDDHTRRIVSEELIRLGVLKVRSGLTPCTPEEIEETKAELRKRGIQLD